MVLIFQAMVLIFQVIGDGDGDGRTNQSSFSSHERLAKKALACVATKKRRTHHRTVVANPVCLASA